MMDVNNKYQVRIVSFIDLNSVDALALMPYFDLDAFFNN